MVLAWLLLVCLLIPDMIFLRFKVEFRFPECPIPLSFITIRFFCKVCVRVWFRILLRISLKNYVWVRLANGAKFILRASRGDIVKNINNDLRNVWKWEWLEKGVAGELNLEYIRIVRLVQFMQKRISYAGRGWKRLEPHLTKKLHRDNVKIESAKYSLFGMSVRKYLDLLLE